MKSLFFILSISISLFGQGQDTVHFKKIDIKLPGSIENNYRMYFYQGEPFTGVIVYPYGQSHYSQILTIRDGLSHGAYATYHKNGQLKEQSNYEFGYKDGESKTWYDNGQLRRLSYLEQNRLIDTVKAWHPNGQLKSWCIEHPWRTYTLEFHLFYDTGQKRAEITHDHQFRWHPNGQLAFKGKIVNHQSHGKLKYFDESGKLIKLEWYEFGTKIKEKEK